MDRTWWKDFLFCIAVIIGSFILAGIFKDWRLIGISIGAIGAWYGFKEGYKNKRNLLKFSRMDKILGILGIGIILLLIVIVSLFA